MAYNVQSNTHTVYSFTSSHGAVFPFFSCYSYITVEFRIQNLEGSPMKVPYFFFNETKHFIHQTDMGKQLL